MKKTIALLFIIAMLTACSVRAEWESEPKKEISSDSVESGAHQRYTGIRYKNGTPEELTSTGCTLIECTSKQKQDECSCVSW